MSEYTKGPWEYRPAMNYIGYAVFPQGTLPSLAACERYTDNMTINCFNFPGSTEANARLIAAAPELLEALQTLVDDCIHASGSMDYNYGKFDLKAAEAAILKATGNQQ